MRTLLHIILVLAASGLLVISGSGCSAKARAARHLAQADRYFDAGDYDKAEIEYKNVLQREPLNPDAISRLGIIYFNQGRTVQVYAFLKKGSELQPDNLDVRLKLGQFYAAAGRPNEAREQALFVLARRPQDEEAPLLLVETTAQPKDIEDTRQRLQKLPSSEGAPVLLALGLLDFRQGKLKEAEATFLRAQALAPKSGAVSLALGTLYAAQNDLPKAEKAFASAAALSPARSAKRIRYAQFCLLTGKPELAKQTLTEITQKAPDYLPAWLLLANIAATEKKIDESLAAVGRILARDPFNVEAVLLDARLKFDKGDKDKAVAELEQAVRAMPQAPQLHYQLGVTYAAMGVPDKAAASLTQALSLVPDIPGAILLLSEINVRQGKVGPAIIALKQLVQKHPEIAQARLLLAQAYRAQGNLDEALAVYRQMEASFAPNPQTSFMIGMVLLQQKKREEASQAFTKSLEIDPGYLPSVEQLVNKELAEKQYAQAIQRVEAQIAKNPKAGELYLLLARAHLAASDTTKAEAALRQVIELQPDSPIGYLFLAQLYVSSNQKEKALTNLQQAVVKNPKNVEALTLIAMIQEQQKNYAAARDSYEKIVALNPKFVVALNNLAYLYSEQFNNLDKAYQLAQQAQALTSLSPDIADTLGWILYKKHQYPYARTLLTEAAEKRPASADIQFHLGMANYMMGEEKPAQAALERAVALSPDFPGIAEARQALSLLAIDPRTGGTKAQATLEKAVAERPDPVAFSRLGAIYEQTGAIDKASGAFESALTASPESITTAMNVIRMRVLRHDTAKALELAKATRKLAPDDPEVAHTLGRLAFGAGDYTWAFSLLQESAHKQPDNSDVLFDLAKAAYSKGQVATAETAMRDALKANPAFPNAAQARAFLEMTELTTHPSQAAAVAGKIEQRLKADPADVPALMAMGAVQEQKSDPAAAMKTYEKALAQYPDFSPAQRRLTILYSTRPGDDPKAVEIATKAREAYPDDAELAKAFGIILYRQGNYTRAMNLLQESSRKLTSDAEVIYYLGMAQYNLKDRASSTRSLQRALELGLKGDLAVEAKKILNPPGKK